MNIWIGAIYTEGAEEDLEILRNRFAQELTNELQKLGLATTLDSLAVVLNIRNPALGVSQESAYFRNADNSYYVVTNVGFDDWANGARPRRADLVAQALDRALNRTPSSRLSDSDKDRIRSKIEEVRKKLRRVLLT